MANYNLAQGGDIHFNENYALYPQNAFIDGRPEFGWSETLLKPAEHWEGGHWAPVRHINFTDCECNLGRIGKQLVTGDTFLTHILPTMSLLTDFHYMIHTPLEGASFTVQVAGVDDGGDPPAPVVLGTIDASVAGDNWFVVEGGLYVPGTTNGGIEFVLDTWPDPEEPTQPEDPCGVFGECPSSVDLCMTLTAFFKRTIGERYCESYCYETCCG